MPQNLTVPPFCEYKWIEPRIGDRTVLAPAHWSDQAVGIVAGQYLVGDEGVPELISRVLTPIADAGAAKGYFYDLLDGNDAVTFFCRLARLVIEQRATFNSPVWYNVGRRLHPQCSACFINAVEDSMDSIMDLAKLEAMLFKWGSGSGTNFSTLRGSCESLTGGGRASGPVSFMRGFDAFAGVIKSGGKTRRAAKMVILNVDHPDIEEFIWCKAFEERKAKALAAAGYPTTVGAPSVFFQNANNSVRVTSAFMRAAQAGDAWETIERTTGKPAKSYRADELLDQLAKAAWECGDPAVQFDDTINKWNTCARDGGINASNPCSEFMFLDDTACNLASINLVPFLNADGSFDIQGFVQAVDTMITAQDILVDFASYPTRKISINSRRYRPLGLGYTNLGAALMRLGLPYDSTEAREWAASVTALMTGAAYATSSRLGKALGAFDRLADNVDHCRSVIEGHRQSLQALLVDADQPCKSIAEAAWIMWERVSPGHLRNAQVTLLAPTGTISFMMDCDTTGIEPAMALVHTKKLADGRELKMVNRSVEPALRRLGYGPDRARGIRNQLTKGSGPMETGIKGEHLAIFDCALPNNAGHCVSVGGHLDMMAAVQPFLSGAISKTVNMPATATVEDVKRVFVRAWQLGLKSVAIYRDGSKAVQPVTTKPTPAVVAPVTAVSKSARQKMPKTRKSITHKFVISGHKGYLTVGLYDDGRPGEVFLHMAKAGSLLSGMADAWAVALSFGLQYGVPLDAFVTKFAHVHFEPAGFTEDDQIRTASSVVDYVVRWMHAQFAGKQQQPVTDQTVLPPSSEARWCLECGAEMTRTGVCWACPTCGASTGCG